MLKPIPSSRPVAPASVPGVRAVRRPNVLLPIEQASRVILDFDIENRPLSYAGFDRTSPDVTAIAWSVVGSGDIECEVLFPPPDDMDSRWEMLSMFADAYDAADIITGHYIRGHDLGIVSGALVELGMEPLGAKLVSDTYGDLRRFNGISKSQENLAALFGIPAPKVSMTQGKWREANRLTDEGIAYTRERVIGDVVQHMELRAALILRGLLKKPRWWRPS